MFYDAGRTMYVPQFHSLRTPGGRTEGSDGEKGYHTFANLTWRDWNLVAYFNSRRKQVPVGWVDAIFDEHGASARDSRNFLEISRSRSIGLSGKLNYRFYYDQYRYDDRFDFDLGDGVVQDLRTICRNDFTGAEIHYSLPTTSRGSLTIGTQAEWELRNYQGEVQVQPSRETVVSLDRPDHTFGVFAQQEWQLAKKWKTNAGVRFDRSSNYGNSWSPRLALLFEPAPTTVIKAVYGRPFRNPSAFEKYFDDQQTLAANLALRPEQAHTLEVSAEHRWRAGWTGIVNFYHYRMRDLIGQAFPAGGVPYYDNLARARTTGVELEASGKLGQIDLLGSVAFQRTRQHDASSLPNSPCTLAKLRAGQPLGPRWLWGGTTLQYMSSRLTNSGAPLSGVLLQDLTLTTQRLHASFDFQVGVYNLWNRRFDDPVGLVIDQLRQDGRTVYLKTIWHGHLR